MISNNKENHRSLILSCWLLFMMFGFNLLFLLTKAVL